MTLDGIPVVHFLLLFFCCFFCLLYIIYCSETSTLVFNCGSFTINNFSRERFNKHTRSPPAGYNESGADSKNQFQN